MGGELVRGQKSYRWYGQYMGDYPLPEGVKQSDLGKCDHTIKFPDCKYEVGVIEQPDGTFALRYDFWGEGGLRSKLGGTRGEKLCQGYAVQKAKRAARKKGLRTQKQVVLADGSVKLVFG